MIVIKTKYLAPTDRRGPRVKAYNSRYSITLPWDHSKETYENHKNAAIALIKKVGYPKTRYVCGWDGKAGYVFVESSTINEISFK